MPKILVPDSHKDAVIQCARYEPKLNRLIEDQGNHYEAADAILDRIVHSATRFELRGGSMRRKKYFFASLLNDNF